MKTCAILVFSLWGLCSVQAQEIHFKGCTDLIENQTYEFHKLGTPDAFGKNIYITSPVTGDQPCGGLGACEFKINWNNAARRWEFVADEGDGTFTNPYVLYYSTDGNTTTVNPPNTKVGNWKENTTLLTKNECGGNLTEANSAFSGDLYDSTLSATDVVKNKLSLFPNPVVQTVSITGIEHAISIQIYTVTGQLIKSQKFQNTIDVSSLPKGIYIYRVTTSNGQTTDLKFIKK